MNALLKRLSKMKGEEKALFFAVLVLLVLIVLCWVFLGRLLFEEKPVDSAAPQTAPETAQAALSTPEDYLPQRLFIGKAPPEAVFQDAAGEAVPLNNLMDEKDAGLWLLFFASWCPDCDRQLDNIQALEALAEKYQVRLVLAHRLNREKESVEAAREKARQKGAKTELVFDGDETVYAAWGFQEIPSAVILKKDGTVGAYAAGFYTAEEYEGLLRRALQGRDKVGLNYIMGRMSNGQGGIFTSTAAAGASPTGKDVLSESQGLMLWYALKKNDRELFDQVLCFTQSQMMKNGLTAWYVSGQEMAGVNAALDDLRIWYALREAKQKWGGEAYALQAEEMAQALSLMGAASVIG